MPNSVLAVLEPVGLIRPTIRHETWSDVAKSVQGHIKHGSIGLTRLWQAISEIGKSRRRKTKMAALLWCVIELMELEKRAGDCGSPTLSLRSANYLTINADEFIRGLNSKLQKQAQKWLKVLTHRLTSGRWPSVISPSGPPSTEIESFHKGSISDAKDGWSVDNTSHRLS